MEKFHFVNDNIDTAENESNRLREIMIYHVCGSLFFKNSTVCIYLSEMTIAIISINDFYVTFFALPLFFNIKHNVYNI